jgi:hypothetical protein
VCVCVCVCVCLFVCLAIHLSHFRLGFATFHSFGETRTVNAVISEGDLGGREEQASNLGCKDQMH